MRKISYFLSLILLLSGCASLSQHLAHFREDVERSKKVAERDFDAPYNEVFLAIVQVQNDTLAAIYVKDFDGGIILAKNPAGLGDFQMPSHNFGFWLKDIGNNKTRVTLRMVDVQWPMGGTAEDEFNMIQRELDLQAKLKGQ